VLQHAKFEDEALCCQSAAKQAPRDHPSNLRHQLQQDLWCGPFNTQRAALIELINRPGMAQALSQRADRVSDGSQTRLAPV